MKNRAWDGLLFVLEVDLHQGIHFLCESSNNFKLSAITSDSTTSSSSELTRETQDSKMRNHADIEEARRGERDTPHDDSRRSKNDFYTKLYKIAFCFMGLQVSYVLWGLVQEHLMTHEYKLGKFRSSAFLVFANRFLALLISLGIVLVQKIMNPNKQTMKAIPFYYYAPSSLSNTISSWAQYEALKYVSFPTQVLSKSCKIIPVMLVSSN